MSAELETGPTDGAMKAARYYDTTQWLYDLSLAFTRTNSMHYGIWYKGDRSVRKAQLNEDNLAAQKLQLKREDILLDAGCGIGGTSVHLAEEFLCKVEGITISEVQMRRAREFAKHRKVEHLVEFYQMDFTSTTFPPESFTKVLAIESVSYAEDKSKFLKEVHRLLRPGGRLVVIDGYLTRLPLAGRELQLYTEFLRGWEIPHLAEKDSFRRMLVDSGFVEVECLDLTENITPSARGIYLAYVGLYPLSLVLGKLHLVSKHVPLHCTAMINQWYLKCDHTISYCLFSARKPTK